MADALPRRTAALKAHLDGYPGAIAEPYAAPRSAAPLILMYKVAGKMFAILGVREEQYVILKTEHAVQLRECYEGIGHRSHLDKRFWISVDLDADVTPADVRKLVKTSYDLVCATLTKKQRDALAKA
jgi:predicted DNA-binding protein (MmcQ/YjbR family)